MFEKFAEDVVRSYQEKVIYLLKIAESNHPGNKNIRDFSTPTEAASAISDEKNFIAPMISPENGKYTQQDFAGVNVNTPEYAINVAAGLAGGVPPIPSSTKNTSANNRVVSLKTQPLLRQYKSLPKDSRYRQDIASNLDKKNYEENLGLDRHITAPVKGVEEYQRKLKSGLPSTEDLSRFYQGLYPETTLDQLLREQGNFY